MATNFKTDILRDKKWMKTVKSLPCVITGSDQGCDPAHIRHGFFGMGVKPPDNLVLPLKPSLHREQHNIGEVVFWSKIMAENPDLMMDCLKAYARELYRKHHG